LILERARNASAVDLLRSRPAPTVTTPLERTAERLPPDLSPTELRALAAVNGKKSALAIVCEGGESAQRSLKAIRELVARGLVREITTTSTLALGTRKAISETHSGSTTSPPKGSGCDNPESENANSTEDGAPIELQKSAPARF